MMSARHSLGEQSGYMSPAMSAPQTDAGPYAEYNASHELENRGGDAKSPVPFEMEGRQPVAQLPGAEHEVAAELEGGDRTRGRFEMD